MKIGTCRCGVTFRQHGNRTGHCGDCHETFTSLAAFDAHQRMLDRAPWQICLNPVTAIDTTGKAVFAPVTTGARDSQPVHWQLAMSEKRLAALDALRERRRAER